MECLIKSLLSLTIFLKLPFYYPEEYKPKTFRSHIQLSVVFTVVPVADICSLIKPLRFVSMLSQFCLTVYIMKLFEMCWLSRSVIKQEIQLFLRRFNHDLSVIWGNSVLAAVLSAGMVVLNV